MNQVHQLLKTLTPMELLFIKNGRKISRKELLLYTFLDLLSRNLLELKKDEEEEVFRVFLGSKSANYSPQEWEKFFFSLFGTIVDYEMGIELNVYAKYLHEKLHNERKIFLHHLESSKSTYFLTLVNFNKKGLALRVFWIWASIFSFFLYFTISQPFFFGLGIVLSVLIVGTQTQVVLTKKGKSIQKKLDNALAEARKKVYTNPENIAHYLTWGANIYLIDTEDKEKLAKIINEHTNLPALFHAQTVFKDKHETVTQNTHSSQTSSFDFVYIQDVFNDAGSSYGESSGSGFFGGGDFGGAGADGGWGDGDGGSGCGSGCSGCGGCGGCGG